MPAAKRTSRPSTSRNDGDQGEAEIRASERNEPQQRDDAEDDQRDADLMADQISAVPMIGAVLGK